MGAPDLTGPQEARLLALERWLRQDGNTLRRLFARLAAVEQGAQDIQFDFGATAPTPTPTPTPPNTTFNGFVSACSGVSASVTITATIGGATLWTGTANGVGAFSGSIFLAVNTAITTTATNGSVRVTTGTSSQTLTAGGVNSISVHLPSSTGYTCTTAYRLPIKSALNLVSSGVCAGTTFPNDTLNAGTGGWNGTTNFHVSGQGLTNFKYRMAVSGSTFTLQIINQTTTGVTNVATLTAASFPPFSASATCGPSGWGGTISE